MPEPILACHGCGRTKPGPTGDPSDVFPSEHCGDCPPWRCERCGGMDSFAAPCPCWQPMTVPLFRAWMAAEGFDSEVTA